MTKPSGADFARLLEESGATLHGHFLLTSGRHSGTYLEKFHLLARPDYLEPFCAALAEHFRPLGVDVVAGPTTGGIILAYNVARLLGARAAYAERNEGRFGRTFRRGVPLRAGERVVIVDDVQTTGGSVRDVIDAVRSAGAEPVAAGLLIDRSAGRVDLGIPYWAVYSAPVESYAADECPLCRQGLPLVKPGGGTT